MSRWRQKGFVQDSDDEEESQVELQACRQDTDPDGRVECNGEVAGSRAGHKSIENGGQKDEEAGNWPFSVLEESTITEKQCTAPTQHSAPTSSPVTPIVGSNAKCEGTVDFGSVRSSASVFPSQLQYSLDFPKHGTSSSTPQPATVSSQILGDPIVLPQPATPKNIGNATGDILGKFGITLLSDDSDGDSLSDPPSDLESPPDRVAFTRPHRRTAVQVVVPKSTVFQRHLEEQALRREFRQRKPIQLHPYAVEGELYRREVQSRGLKPVARVRSPQRHNGGDDGESQEKAFDPNEAPSSSPPEPEDVLSTPTAPRLTLHQRQENPGRQLNARSSRRLPSTQLRLPPAAKDRTTNRSLTQASHATINNANESSARRDIWSIPPQSPPYSSSPLLPGINSARRVDQIRLSIPVPNPLTPSTSSVFQEDARPPQDDDSDPVPRTAPRPVGKLRRPSIVSLSDSHSSSSVTSSEPEDQQLRQVRRKIKGVLPASWLRFDKQTQERRKAQERERDRLRIHTIQSGSPDEPQRGIAQRVTRPVGQRRMTSVRTASSEALIMSAESDDESVALAIHATKNRESTVEAASAVAAVFDDRYADDDLSDMENDRLHLPTLGGGGSKRNRQPKITDMLGGGKKRKLGGGLARPVTSRKQAHHALSRRRNKFNHAIRRSSPPAMSIVDVEMPPTTCNSDIPQFLRVARRQALRRPDLARQSPNTKQIRLYNAKDTEDANLALRNWCKGSMKQMAVVASERRIATQSLAHKRDDPKISQKQQRMSSNNANTLGERRGRELESPQALNRKRLPYGLQVFTRSRTPKSSSSQRTEKQTRGLQRGIHAAPTFRTAQLEGDEGDFGYDYRRIAFEKGLRRVDRQFDLPMPQETSPMNPQLARFLADDHVTLPPMPASARIGEREVKSSEKQVQLPKKRLVRKRPAQRVDVDTREHRQPSEPAVQELLATTVLQPYEAADQNDTLLQLQGLGQHGARYPMTFDVYSLASGTYFHSATFVGSGEFRCALATGASESRNLDEPAGYCTFTYGPESARFGPWAAETCSVIEALASSVFAPLNDHSSMIMSEIPVETFRNVIDQCVRFLRTLIGYVSNTLYFSDPIDRNGCVAKMTELCQRLFSSVLTAQDGLRQLSAVQSIYQNGTRALAYLLVMAAQIHRIAQHPKVESDSKSLALSAIKNISNVLVTDLVHQSIPKLSDFLEQNKRHAIRESGIQDTDVLAECVVLCMQTLENIGLPRCRFWDHVYTVLSPLVMRANHVSTFETAWATISTLLPFGEVDVSGIPSRSRECVQGENWTGIRDLLRRLFELYPTSSRKHGTSLNEYVRSNLARCHRLIKYWHWERPEQMLNITFDFFLKNGLRELRHEASKGSVSFLDNLSAEQSLALEPNETAFHIALKCLAIGLRGMSRSYAEKRIRSFVFRTIPNHGRAYPKDQSLDEQSLAALRNHHDLLSVLYWAAPSLCRPKLDHIRDLVNHESSHREACRLNVRAWANLTTFQLSSEEPYANAKPFALWFEDIMRQSLKQYRVAKNEADDYLKSNGPDDTADVSAVMVRRMMERNQEQVIATLRDCIAGMRKAIKNSKDVGSLATFLHDSDIAHLLELPHLKDRRLIQVIRDALVIFREYATNQTFLPNKAQSQMASEESQDYGDFPDLDDLEEHVGEPSSGAIAQSALDYIQNPLWHLLSNAFGAESAPDDNLLMDCVETWVCVARAQVCSGQRAWSYYIDPYSQASWTQLRQTEQTRKFGPYFMAALIDTDSGAYEEHRHELFQAMLLSLVERESMLCFQHRLLAAILRTDNDHPLLQNLPYIRKQNTYEYDVTAETLRSRRLTLISSILSNIRDEADATAQTEPGRTAQVKESYVSMLKDFMTRMKFNYQQLQQGTDVAGAYVEFVQKIVQFLKQYTNDICPVFPFFTDSLAFPLPAGDPSYVVARLCGYAPKVAESGTARQLSVFIQNVAQQAAANNHQSYLVNQLTTSLCTDEAPAADREMLRSMLLQNIFPAYLEEAFTSGIGSLIAKPILRALPIVIDSMMFDLRITQQASFLSTIESMVAISHAFIRGTDHVKNSPTIFREPHVLSTLTHMFEAMASITLVMDYMCSPSSRSEPIEKPSIIAYMEQLTTFLTEMLQDALPTTIPEYEGNALALLGDKAPDTLVAYCRVELQESLRRHWSENEGVIWFGQGQARREVLFDLGIVEEEKGRLENGIDEFRRVLRSVYGGELGSVMVEFVV